nr:DUF11 domain-containing protein [Methanobacterium formicicum]
MHAINPNGTLKWTSNIPSSTKPAIAKDGTLYGGGTFVDGSPELEIYTSIIYAFMAPASDIYLLTSINNPNPTLGDIVTATLKLGNNGPNVAYQTILKFTIPEGMQFINTWQITVASITILLPGRLSGIWEMFQWVTPMLMFNLW